MLRQRCTEALCESTPPFRPLPSEIELQSLWFNGQFGRDFTTKDGLPIQIIQFGEWNRGQGPDFLRAVVHIGGKPHYGPLEIDTRPSDWVRHRHASNPSFDETILHIVFEDEMTTTFTQTSNNRHVPRLLISQEQIQSVLDQPLYTDQTVHLVRCSTPLNNLSSAQIEQFMLQAAQHRLQRKYAIHQRTSVVHGQDQTLWLHIAEALGYRHNQLNMVLLAQRIPIQTLTQQKENILPLLFGTAGYLHPDIHKKAQHDGKQWLRNLWDHWWQIRQNFELSHERTIPWSRAAIRPANHPQRRLAALACIAQRWTEFKKANQDPQHCLDFLTDLKDDFWNFHYTLTSQPSSKPLRLIGKDRAQDFLMNHVYPPLLSSTEHSSIERHSDKAHWNQYKALPAQSSSDKVAKAAQRLFGSHPDKAKFTKRAWQHQALLQIYTDFCLADTTDCNGCSFPEQLPTWICS